MTLEEEKRMSKGWRGRRYIACRATDQIERVIENLGADDGENPAPDNGLPEVSEAMKQEMKNLSSVLLRMILAANDGQVSSQTLRHY